MTYLLASNMDKGIMEYQLEAAIAKVYSSVSFLTILFAPGFFERDLGEKSDNLRIPCRGFYLEWGRKIPEVALGSSVYAFLYNSLQVTLIEPGALLIITVTYSYLPDSVIPEFAHTGLREFQSPAQKQLTVFFLYSLVFGYNTGFLIYRTQKSLVPTTSPV